jgi:hypothetical protein
VIIVEADLGHRRVELVPRLLHQALHHAALLLERRHARKAKRDLQNSDDHD